jgi:uncharacterized protein (TIGR02611 family)
MSAGEEEPSALDRLDDPVERLAENRARRWYELGRSPNVIVRQAYRMIVLVVGLTIVAGGIAMVVLPGPGFLVVIAGLAILATEFVWARLLLQRAKVYAQKAKEKAMGKGGLGGLKRKVTRKP